MPAPEKVQACYQTREVQKTVTLSSFEDEVLDGAYPSDDYDPLREDEDIKTENLPQTQPAQQSVPAPGVKPKTDMEKVLEAFRENPLYTYREIGERAGFKKDKVGELLSEARERGLIKKDE